MRPTYRRPGSTADATRRALVERLRAERIAEGVPVAIMTAAMPGASTLPAADAYLSKPFDLEELLQVVGRHAGPPGETGGLSAR